MRTKPAASCRSILVRVRGIAAAENPMVERFGVLYMKGRLLGFTGRAFMKYVARDDSPSEAQGVVAAKLKQGHRMVHEVNLLSRTIRAPTFGF
jgi:hypothetical protein